uniref:Putative DNA methyltransferase n=1 Tax=Tydemania expeditionis TaxID=325645 RepID=A0A0D6E213_TYDEX|nr:putative DNA methyltransferase [Tydemania expeditionis]CEO91078.1 putative DNA methyltransferase [Tydemania expeditionis]
MPILHIFLIMVLYPTKIFLIFNSNKFQIVICADLPCQAFSNIGLKKGWKDSRSQVFYPLLNILKFKKIPCIILENVTGLVNLKKGQVFNKILTHLKDLNYECFWEILNCSDYGIPQNRKRLFIVGFHKTIFENIDNFEFPPKKHLSGTLSEFLNKKFNQKIARTIRVGGRSSPLNSRYNWDGYTLENSQNEYRLSVKDCLVL